MSKKRRIVIVDDNRDFATNLEFLKSADSTMEKATSYEEGVNLAKSSNEPTLFVLDWNLGAGIAKTGVKLFIAILKLPVKIIGVIFSSSEPKKLRKQLENEGLKGHPKIKGVLDKNQYDPEEWQRLLNE